DRMPKQNRVTPFSEIIATPARGTLMGNRGCLHNTAGEIRRSYQVKRWIICLLEFKGRHRTVMTPGHYTELFFLDEATALAAGHRPCAECMYPRFKEFCQLWVQANPEYIGQEKLRVKLLDTVLHQQRLTTKREKATYNAPITALPDGTFIIYGPTKQPHLISGTYLFPWSPAGYQSPSIRSQTGDAEVLTPLSVVRTLSLGYRPVLHASVTL
ncbi:MAG: hypothetical protein AAF485_32010, partial [Chloroflexota bacterium]